DDAALLDRHFFGGEVNAHVATGDHDAIRLGDDVVEVFDGLAALDLGDDGDVGAGLEDGLAGKVDVGGGVHEAQREQVDARLGADLDGLAVAVGERGEGKVGGGEGNALVGGEETADGDPAIKA